MKKWMAAVGLVLLLLVGVMPAMVATAGIRDPILTGTSAESIFKNVDIEDKTIAGGESTTFSVKDLQDNVLAAVKSGTTILMGFKWDVKKNGINYTNDNSYSDMFTVTTVIDNQLDTYGSILTINAVEGNCILDGATVTLTMITKKPRSGEAETITFTDKAKLTVSHTTGDWVLDEEASSGALQVSHKTCSKCGTVDTKTEVVPLENPVYVGGEALKNAGASVTGGSGTATLHIAQDGSPVLVLDNYVYTGSGYEYESGKFAGIYYAGTGDFYLIPGTEASGIASTNSITVTAENATYSYGICLPSAKLHIGGSENGAADSLTVTGGPAKQYSAGIYVAGMYSYQSEQVQVITDPETLTEEPLNFGGNFTLNAAGGTVSGSNYTYSHGIWIKNETESMFSGGTINATGGQATANSGVRDYEGFSYGIRAGSGTSVLFNGATVTARGGNNSEAVEGSTTRTSYGCNFSEFELSAGSLTAIGGDITGTDSIASRVSYGLYGTGSITITGGTLTATGGNTIKGWSYGIESKGLSVSGNAVVTANSNGTTDTRKIGINIIGNAGTMSVADNATVTASASDAGGIYAHYGLFMEGSSSTYTQTGGTVLLTAYSEDTGANNAGAYFSSGNKATISGGTFTGRATVKGIGATDLIINGGTVTGISEIHNDIKPAADATSYGISAYSLVLTDGELIGTGSDSYDYKWTTGIRIGYQSTISGGTVTGTGGNVYVGDSGYNSIQSVGVEFVALNMSAGTVTGNAGAVDKPQNNYSIGVNITDSSTVSGTAKINGTGLTAGVNCINETITVSGDAAITGTGKTGIDLKYLSMPAEENNAVVTGISNASENGTGIYLIGKGDNESVLAGGKLNATAPETGNNHIGLRSLGTITTTGTLITAKGGSKAMEIEGNNASKNIVVADVIVVSENYSGTTGKKALSIGGHTSEELAAYKYTEAGNRSELGFEPTKRSLSDAVITLTETLTYNGSEQTQGFVVSVAGVELTAGEHFTVTGEKATDAGTYTLILTAKPDTDYTGTATMEYTVSRWDIGDEATVTVTGGPYAYQSTVDPAAVIVKHGDVVLELNKDYTVEIHTSSVGENGGSVYVSSMAGSNYVWNAWIKTNFTVVKAENPVEVTTPLTVIRGGNWVYLAYSNNQAGNPSYSIVGDALGCIIENGALTSGDTEGTVTVQATFPASNFYNEAERTVTVTITDKNRAELDWVILNDVDYQYNDATELAQVYHSGSGSRVKEDIIEYSGTTRSGATYARSTTPPTQAGNYTVHVTYETKDTIYTGSDDFVIRPKDISSLITVTLGDELTYNGTEQTQTVTEVRDANADYTFNETEYTITGNKQTNAGYYSLDITGKGNFTGTKTVSYEIAKATPSLEDFEIPAFDDTVDYTGEYIEITPPTSTKNGMGNTYIETYVRNAGTYDVTFRVSEGTNYTAASGFTYGTITVNKVYRNISTTDAVVGINGKMIDLDERVAGEENIGATFTIVAGDDLGCTINGSTFFSGSKAGNVTVQVTVSGDNNYLETIRTFTVEVVEVGGVKVWGGVTSSGSSSDETTIQLLQGGEVKYEMTILGNSIAYSFDGVAAGTYTLRVSKANHITVEKEVTVASEDVHVETVELKTESDILTEQVENVTIRHNCSFGSDFTLVYAIPKSELEGFENIRLSVEKDVYSGDILTGTETVVLDWVTDNINGEAHYRFEYSDIAACEIGDEVRAVLSAEKDGEVYYGIEDIYTIKDYAYSRLTKSSDTVFKRLIVDMLNFCAASQQYFGYREDALVNASLTEEQKALSTGTYNVLQNNDATIISLANKTVPAMRKNVRFGNRIEAMIAMDLSQYADLSGIVLHVEYTDFYGTEKVLNIPSSQFEFNSGVNMYCGLISTLKAADFRKVMTISVWKDGVVISDTVTYSIETYVCKKLSSSSDVIFKALLEKMMIYGDSTEAYFDK